MAGSKRAKAPVAETGYKPRRKGLKRRELFLEAATEAFSRNGYEATSLQDIVTEAGGSLATLYRMFGNKEGLFQAVIDHKFQSVFGGVIRWRWEDALHAKSSPRWAWPSSR